MIMIDPAIGCFDIFWISTFNHDGVIVGDDEYINKYSDRVSQMFNNTWICRYLCTRKVVFDNGSEFKQDFTPFLKDFEK